MQLDGITTSVQDYLKTIYSLEERGSEATTSQLATDLGVAPASVTAMVKKLAERDLVLHTPYHGFTLTPAGRALALEVVRTHRLLEAFLFRVIGVPIHELHEEAELLEHAISERLRKRIDELLGHPTHDPHGHPIPNAATTADESPHDVLVSTPAGVSVRVERVPDHDSEALRYLAELGIVPGAEIEVVELAPFGGPVWLRVEGERQALGAELASRVQVSVLGEAPE